MTTPPSFDFEKLVPGFEFLKSMGQNKTSNGFPSASSWIAPTLDPKELDRKIQELKTVQFWLDQNAKALGATIQALEVQKMTLSTLKGMNFNMQELSESFKSNANAWMFPKKTENGQEEAMQNKAGYSFTSNTKNNESPKSSRSNRAQTKEEDKENSTTNASTQFGGIDPAVWWNSLGEQFQQIAQKTIQDMQKHAAHNNELLSRASSQKNKPAPSAKRTPRKAAVKKTNVRK